MIPMIQDRRLMWLRSSGLAGFLSLVGMRTVGLALVCFACVGHGRTIHNSSESTGGNVLLLQSVQSEDNTGQLKMLTSLLLSYNPAAGLQIPLAMNNAKLERSRAGSPELFGTRAAPAGVLLETSSGVSIPEKSFLNQERAIQVDVDLMSSEGGFSIDQLMELAGLSVASAVAKEYPADSHPKVLIICGPGNNGGDGLVAARHLHHFGYKPTVIYPKMDKVISGNALYRRLTVQLAQLGVQVTGDWQPSVAMDAHVIVDAIFGFSFKGWRGNGKDAPFDDIVRFLSTDEGGAASFSAPLVSVDIPSGWDVESGPPDGVAIRPDMLISLTAPKQCALSFRGKFHYLGGRFVPPSIISKNNLELPVYPGAEQCVKLAVS